MDINDDSKAFIKEMMDYDDEEVETFLADPRNLDILDKMVELADKTIVVEIVESHGCFIGHRAGDRI